MQKTDSFGNLTIGRRLQAIREDRKMSQAEFAEILSMSQSTYSRMEMGKTHIGFDELAHIAETLDVPIHELLPEASMFHLSNSGQGAASITFGNCIFHIGTDASVKALEEEKKALEEKVRQLEKQLRQMDK